MCVFYADIPYGPLRLNVEPYQDHDNGCHEAELNGQVAWIGTLQLYIPKVLILIILIVSNGYGRPILKGFSFPWTDE